MTIFLIDFHIKKNKNYILATAMLEKMTQKDVSIWDHYEVLRIKQMLSQTYLIQGYEKFDDRNLDEFIYYEDTYNLLQNKTKSILSNLLQFWNHMSTQQGWSDSSLKQLIEIVQSKEQCLKIWKNLERYFKYNLDLTFLHKLFEKAFFNK